MSGVDVRGFGNKLFVYKITFKKGVIDKWEGLFANHICSTSPYGLLCWVPLG